MELLSFVVVMFIVTGLKWKYWFMFLSFWHYASMLYFKESA